jgi:hypothetical protein
LVDFYKSGVNILAFLPGSSCLPLKVIDLQYLHLADHFWRGAGCHKPAASLCQPDHNMKPLPQWVDLKLPYFPIDMLDDIKERLAKIINCFSKRLVIL